ncbi:enoyl-CoA hydratase [Actinomycetospora sp. NBRC 106375]|uniref:enoyl-CoA hydratase/isomerase family protein n=1 Tax=Actinomycetospora sp. NBRC 106375 TaxID=3032207 RepID=UPI0024A38395|nr:enoyl-CoA hydratase-related protein [Actinomycetospora sp. NBRC 106375]GLZ47928.1 enoyl-CoA hydratase [Actinomycetospora sp. NBRC 106375]
MPIRVEDDATDPRVTVLTIDRPEARNALDPEHQAALGDAVFAFESDDTKLVAVLTGAGDTTFSAGADLKRLIPTYRHRVRAGEDPPWNFGGFTATERAKPLIAAVNGHALAGGLEMALACDIRLCSQNATFGLAETKWAIIPGAGGTVRLPRAVPLGLAMEMILSGEPIDAAEAHRVGLVNRVVPLRELLPRALELARSIADRGPLAVREARARVLDGLGLEHDEAMAREHAAFLRVMRTDDAEEGPAAFAEKRPPRYEGR